MLELGPVGTTWPFCQQIMSTNPGSFVNIVGLHGCICTNAWQEWPQLSGWEAALTNLGCSAELSWLCLSRLVGDYEDKLVDDYKGENKRMATRGLATGIWELLPLRRAEKKVARCLS